MYETCKGSTYFRRFDSLASLVELAEAAPAANDVVSWDQDFVGRRFSLKWQAAKAALHEAWPDGLEIVDRMLNDIGAADLPAPKSRRRRPQFDEVDGDEIDYDRLRCGQSFWRRTSRQVSTGPTTITVFVDVGANCSVKHSDILWRGAAAIALTQILEDAGYRVELWANWKTTDVWTKGRNYYHMVGAVCLKRASDPLDRSSLIAAVSGWAFRTTWFRSACNPSDASFTVRHSLGHSCIPTAAEIDEVIGTADENRVVVAGTFSYKGAVDIVRDALKCLV